MKRKLAGRITALACMAVLAVMMTACGKSNPGSALSAGGESAADSDISVGIVLKTATNAHFQDIAYGAMLAGQDLGISVRVDNTTTETDIEGQVTKIENMISAGVDAVILTANDSNGVSGAVNAAHDAGIPFVTADTEITNVWGDDVKEYMPNFVGEDYEELAYELAFDVCEHMGGKGNMVVLRGIDGASSSQQRTAGIKRAIAEHPDMTIVEEQSANYDQDTAVDTMADIIQAHPQIDGVICCNDLMAMGAVTALEESGLTVGGEDGVVVSGLDGNIIALQSIQEGKMYATIYDWSLLQGYYSVMQAYDLIQGKEVPEETLTKGSIITAENVDDYLPHGEVIADWQMGKPIGDVPESIRTFFELGESLK